MRRTLVALTSVIATVSLSGCQLVAALMPSDVEQLPVEGICATYRVVDPDDSPVTRDILEQTRAIIKSRVDATGVAEPVVVAQGQDRILVELPGVEDDADIDSFRRLIGSTGVLEFVPVPPELQGTLEGGPLPEAMRASEPLFTGVAIASAVVGQDPTTGGLMVDLQLQDTEAHRFDGYASEHFGEQVAIVLDDEVISAPTINDTDRDGRVRITDSSGGFTPQEASDLVTMLRFGPLPVAVREVAFGACAESGSSALATETQHERQVADAPVTARSASAAPPWFGSQRVELPAYGVALTVPEGWVGIDLKADIDEQFEASIAALADGVPGFPSMPLDVWTVDAAEAWAQSNDEWVLLVFSPTEGDVCGVSVLPLSWTLHDPEIRTMVDTIYREDGCFSGYDGMEPLDLPSGSALMLHVDDVCDHEQRTLYSILAGDRAAEVRCEASGRPEDDWRPIAESFEFLAEPPRD